MIYIHVRVHTNAIVLNYAIDTRLNVQRNVYYTYRICPEWNQMNAVELCTIDILHSNFFGHIHSVSAIEDMRPGTPFSKRCSKSLSQRLEQLRWTRCDLWGFFWAGGTGKNYISSMFITIPKSPSQIFRGSRLLSPTISFPARRERGLCQN